MGHGSDTHSPCPPPSSPSCPPTRQSKSIGRHPHPSHHRAGKLAAGPEQARVPFGLSVPVSSLQKTKESQERKEKAGQTKGGGERPNRGEGGGDSRLVYQIPTMQPQLPGPAAPRLANGCSSDAEGPTGARWGRPGSGRHRRGAREAPGLVRQPRLTAASVAAAPAPPDVMCPPSSAPRGAEPLLLGHLATTGP